MIDRRDLFRLRMWTNDYNWDWGDYKMIYDVECRDYTQNTMLSVSSFEELLDNHDTYNIMLCTGIKDSKGKLIYENDIIEITYNEKRKVKYIVKFGEHIQTYEQLASVGFYIQELEDGSVWKLNNDKRTITTIIGNIYETEEFMHLQGAGDLPSATFMQSMIDNYSDNDEHSDGSVEEAYEQAENEFREWFKLKSDIPLIKSEIPIPFKTHYRRKSDEKHFVFICSEIGKIQMKGITPEKEVVEKNVGSVMMYGLMSFDISKETVVVDENQLQEEYERLN